MTLAARILVVDDDEEMLELLSSVLTVKGYEVETACDGEEALQKVNSSTFDLVISDIQMPKVSGIEVLEAINKNSPRLGVIILTSQGSIEGAVEAMKKGACYYLQKPFEADEMVLLVERALEKNELNFDVGIYEASRILFETVRLEELLPRLVELARIILKADDASIMLLKGEELELAAATGSPVGEQKTARLRIGERVAGKAAQLKETVRIEGAVENDPRFVGVEGLRDIKASIIQPLMNQGKVLGILSVNRTQNQEVFNDADERHVVILSAQISQAIANAQLFQELERKIEALEAAREQTKDAQAQVMQAEKLAGVGRLATGIAHELSNPLTTVIGTVQLLLEKKGFTAEQVEDLKIMEEEGRRCRRIVQDLMQFSRKEKPHLAPQNLAAILERVLQLAGYQIKTSGTILVKGHWAEDIQVYADKNQLQQVFLNLISNAVQAMESSPEKRLSLSVQRREDKALVIIEDTGTGMPEKDLSRIFDPFFTTKQAGQGTGLGLSVSHTIIANHRGSISASNSAAKGAAFTVELPVYEEKAAGAPAAVPELLPPRKRIILVDDEIGIQRVMRQILSTLGVELTVCSGVREGIGMIEAKDYDLLITDLRLKDGHGQEIVKSFRGRFPDAPIVIITGSPDDSLAGLANQKNIDVILKPFELDQVRGSLRTALGRKKG